MLRARDSIIHPTSTGLICLVEQLLVVAAAGGMQTQRIGASATLRMINSTCANPKQLWKSKMQSTTWPSEEQLAELRTASQVCTDSIPIITDPVTGDTLVEVTLEAYAAAELMVPSSI
eukprot:SAG11_NODE_6193_length_1368_cov_1.008668_1_plen_118_part_00